MKSNVSYYDFFRAFQDIRPDNFSDTGLKILYESLVEIEEDCGEEMELDVIAFCCDYNEYTLEEFNNEYDLEFEDMDDLAVYLNNKTYVCGFDSDEDVIVFQAY